ncbi:probable AdoMet-dependent rRNA methyltransferase spb-1 [Cephalotrichum gorgonifer]|uniref:Probable AdoMet-dependent rRNA methyltransferase spb-1 n=1 Tax=Cephalotrichum gorgonifer TaxID=2041049 RepID=A0AAE8STK5_9PEZI|nr:probable AdoMet-dependent rRNA methyltransferase spb-1 [Cephalotrichum gorgonifer]
MAIQKKHGKGRLDKWYKLAKEKGYRARAAFKLIQLNKKYGFLEKSKVLIDLCAAPGSWTQVAAETMPAGSLIVGVDLSPIKPIPRAITFQGDITTEKCRATLRHHLKTWKADTVLHDGAPNVGTAWTQDSFNQAELVLQSMKLATEFLVEGGTFVTKVFRSKDYNPLLWVFNQLFTKVEATKPPSSRNVSAEIFVVCRGFKAPKKIDPRFLDPRSVFEELAAPAPNNEAKVYNPEVKKRKRDGYEEGDYTQFKEVSASEFINNTDPIAILGSSNRISFVQPPGGDIALAALDKLPETTDDIRNCCLDLKVLGRKEFKMLLKWRLKAREIFGLAAKKAEPEEEVAEVEPMDEELRIQQELQNLKDKESAKRKRERRRENEQKRKEIVRMQMNMVTPMDIGMEQDGPMGEDSMFRLKSIDKEDALRRIARGNMAIITKSEKKPDVDSGIGSSADTDSEDEAEEGLEQELDAMYEQYTGRVRDADPKARAKRAREEHDDEWEGLSADEKKADDDDSELEEESGDEGGDYDGPKKLLTDLDNEPTDSALSKRARNFFDQDIFKGVLGGDSDEEIPSRAAKSKDRSEKATSKKTLEPVKSKAVKEPESMEVDDDSEDSEEEVEFELDKREDEDDWEMQDKKGKDGKIDIDIVTAEAMTLAHELATGKKTKSDLVDDGFNKWAFRDRDNLPEWFLDDEHKHDKPLQPITKQAAKAIQEKMRALNARPIKKVQEAKARKKIKTAQRLEKLKKKSDMLADDEGLTEKEKASSIMKLMANAAKKRPRKELKVVVARNTNKGIKGRPKGVKGRYRMVDPRMKKELRKQKVIAKRK